MKSRPKVESITKDDVYLAPVYIDVADTSTGNFYDAVADSNQVTRNVGEDFYDVVADNNTCNKTHQDNSGEDFYDVIGESNVSEYNNGDNYITVVENVDCHKKEEKVHPVPRKRPEITVHNSQNKYIEVYNTNEAVRTFLFIVYFFGCPDEQKVIVCWGTTYWRWKKILHN